MVQRADTTLLTGAERRELGQLENTFKEICAEAVEPDGMVFPRTLLDVTGEPTAHSMLQ